MSRKLKISSNAIGETYFTDIENNRSIKCCFLRDRSCTPNCACSSIHPDNATWCSRGKFRIGTLVD